MKKIVLITGASSGIGRATALLLADSGYTVFATVRSSEDAEKLKNEGFDTLKPLLLDVTNSQHIVQAYQQISAISGNDGIIAVINNAGLNYTTSTEEANLEEARYVVDVLFWGGVTIIQKFLPLLRQYAKHSPNAPRIINVSSVGGISAFPYIQFYNAAKFAMIGFTESLRFELNPFGIKAIAILPGSVKTSIWKKADDSTQQALSQGESLYNEYLQKAHKFSTSYKDSGVSPEQAALVIKKALEKRKPALKYLIGTDAKILQAMVKFLPDSWRHKILQSQLGF